MRSIYLVRHGIPDFPDGKIIIQGRYTDLGLDDRYAGDADNLKPYFADKNIENWYSSPLLRAKQTLMHFIPGNAGIQVIEGATEVAFGSWEGRSWDECRILYPDTFEKRKTNNSLMPSDGEQLKDGALRMLNALKQTESNCVIATHWVATASICCLLTDYPYSQYLKLNIPYLSVTEIEENEGIFTVREIGKKVCSTPMCDTFVYH